MRRGRGTALRIGAALSAVATLAIVAAACGGDDSKSVGTPVLGGTTIPTVPRPSPTPPVCDVEEPVAMPPDFPAEFPVPDGFVASSVTRDPHLTVVGRVSYPNTEDNLGLRLADRVLVDGLRENWELDDNPNVEGDEYRATNDDGRVAIVRSVPVLFCLQHAQVEYEFLWITPAAGAPSPTPNP